MKHALCDAARLSTRWSLSRDEQSHTDGLIYGTIKKKNRFSVSGMRSDDSQLGRQVYGVPELEQSGRVYGTELRP